MIVILEFETPIYDLASICLSATFTLYTGATMRQENSTEELGEHEDREQARVEVIHKLFERQARKTPDAIAVVADGMSMTYGELDRRANRLARRLRSSIRRPDERVAVCVERGFGMVIAVLGVLKAGGAYIPLDPNYPLDRLEFMLSDGEPIALVTQERLKHLFNKNPGSLPTFFVDEEDPLSDFHDDQTAPTEFDIQPDHLAYMIYTSGSTGRPKGVMIQHRGLCNLIESQISLFGIEDDSRILQCASFSFDACVSEMFMALCKGAALHLPSERDVLAGAYLAEIIAKQGITHATITPSVLSTVPEASNLEPLQTLIAAGEALSPGVARRWVKSKRLINAYGPTEIAVCATVHLCREEETGPPPIGRPIRNTSIYILNEQTEPCPVGEPGEIYIGGIGVARGYWNRPELTAERFLVDPYGTVPGARMYRTGDIGRVLPNGEIEFLGRADSQVKVRGFRIELGEIEARLAQHPFVREAVVIAPEVRAGEKRLVAFYTAAGEASDLAENGDARSLRTHLLGSLPEYMVPKTYVRLDRIPLTPNGKLDVKSLLSHSMIRADIPEEHAPRGATELLLSRIWADILHVDKIGRSENFFEAGGDSLLAAKCVQAISKHVGHDCSAASLLQSPTIASYAAFLDSGEAPTVAILNEGLRNNQSQKMFWINHPHPLQRLVTLLPDLPAYSVLLSREEAAAAGPEYRMEVLAERVVEHLLMYNPHGDFYLGGFCQNAMLAFEVAQQLKARNRQVGLVVMVDPNQFSDGNQSPSILRVILRQIDREIFHITTLLRLRPSKWLGYIQRRQHSIKHVLEGTRWQRAVKRGEISSLVVSDLTQALFVATMTYRPRKYDGEVLFIRPTLRPRGKYNESLERWRAVAPRLTAYDIHGDHQSLFDSPGAEQFAEHLRTSLQGDSMRKDRQRVG
jgi:amino acid adenylation domain-containing protein